MKKRIFYGLAAAWAIICLSACSQDDFIAEKTNEVKSSRPAVSLIVTQGSQTRTVLTDLGLGKGLSGTWQTTDNIGVWNITEGLNLYQTVQPQEEAKNAEFIGTINCQDGDRLAFFYPRSSSNIECDPTEPGKVNIDFTHQGGTLEAIANQLDLVYGTATVRMSGSNATANLGVMNAAHAVWNTKIYDSSADTIRAIEKLYVKIIQKGNGERYKKLQGVLNLATQEFTTRENANKDDFITITLDKPTKEIYFVTPPALENIYFEIEAVDEYGISHNYNMYKNGAAENGNAEGLYVKKVNPGKFYRFTVKKTNDGDYIEFDDVKWATGNLIWSNGNSYGSTNLWKDIYNRHLNIDNYFVAPSQEWSPEQIMNKNFNSFSAWPEKSPVAGSTVNDAFFSIFIAGAVGKHGVQSSRGGNIMARLGSYSFGGTSLGALMLGTDYLDFRRKIYYSPNEWTYSYNEITFQQLLTGNYDDQNYITGVYKGDLAYVATKGRYALPTDPDIEALMGNNNKYHRAWGVIWVETSASSVCKAHNFSFSGTKAPIFGLFISKKPLTGYAKDPTYNYAIRLEKADMKKGIFLPAEGYTSYLSDGTSSNDEAGHVCCYITGILNEGGSANGLGDNMSYGRAAYQNGTFTHGAYKNGGRTGRYAIRPVYIGE